MRKRCARTLPILTMLVSLASGCAWFGNNSAPYSPARDDRPCYLKILSPRDLPYATVLDPRAQAGDVLKARWCEDEDHADLLLDALRLSH